ncbi:MULTISPECIES: hypothetical protein [Halobacterium]|uniref:hypothetical protein n=1 Tax=Halobacterium TaxID=2239 RepID=UPI00073E9D18|nr:MULTISPECIES: hypothetical protein [Halobacterium]MCG1002904.1 hypothetical protein [Halobacterium noricense]
MSRITETRGVAGEDAVGLGKAYAVVDRHVGTWLPVAWKLAVFYAAWLGLAVAARSVLVAPEALQLVAIAYWFGWLFAIVTAVVGAVVVLTGVVDQYRLTERQAKY